MPRGTLTCASVVSALVRGRSERGMSPSGAVCEGSVKSRTAPRAAVASAENLLMSACLSQDSQSRAAPRVGLAPPPGGRVLATILQGLPD